MKGYNTDFETIIHKKWPDSERRSMWTRIKRTPPECAPDLVSTLVTGDPARGAWLCAGTRTSSHGRAVTPSWTRISVRRIPRPGVPLRVPCMGNDPSVEPDPDQTHWNSASSSPGGPDPVRLRPPATHGPGRKPVRGPGLRLERGGAGEREQVHTSPPPAAASILMLYPTLS